MLKLAPVLLAVAWGLFVYLASARRVRKELDRNSRPCGDTRLNELVTRLADELDLDHIPVFVHESLELNGTVSPDGRVFITRGFLDKYRLGQVTAEELTTVVAHELGHLALDHTQARMLDFATQNAMRAALHMVIGRFLPIVGGVVASFAVSLLTAKLSRSDEFEADKFAALLLLKSGIGTEPQISLFRKLPNLTGLNISQIAWLTASHPSPEARVAAIEAIQSEFNATA